jgi:hypothetical protein
MNIALYISVYADILLEPYHRHCFYMVLKVVCSSAIIPSGGLADLAWHTRHHQWIPEETAKAASHQLLEWFTRLY